jgi:CDGSH-type Zn-finger protein
MAEPIVIRCRENGPLVLPAEGVKVIDHQGNEFPIPDGKGNIALCRCGQSATKPFCDGSHKGTAFRAANMAPAQENERPA